MIPVSRMKNYTTDGLDQEIAFDSTDDNFLLWMILLSVTVKKQLSPNRNCVDERRRALTASIFYEKHIYSLHLFLAFIMISVMVWKRQIRRVYNMGLFNKPYDIGLPLATIFTRSPHSNVYRAKFHRVIPRRQVDRCHQQSLLIDSCDDDDSPSNYELSCTKRRVDAIDLADQSLILNAVPNCNGLCQQKRTSRSTPLNHNDWNNSDCCTVHCPITLATQKALQQTMITDVNTSSSSTNIYLSLDALLKSRCNSFDCHALSMDYADASDITTVETSPTRVHVRGRISMTDSYSSPHVPVASSTSDTEFRLEQIIDIMAMQQSTSL